jgi:hypothetical protein
MAKTKLSQYDATAANNTDVANINIAEGCSPSNINNAIRAVMGHLKDFQAGNSTGNALAVASGGTGAENASGARTNLGLGTISTQDSDAVSITGGSVTGITDLAVADGGTGTSEIEANAVVLGNGTSAIQTVAPGDDGNILTSDGTTWTSGPAPSTIASIQAFTASGTFTVPANVTKIKVIVTGGGGGGSTTPGAYAANGGGAGGTAIKVISGLTPGATIAVTVGGGGGANSAGGQSKFGTYCTGNGGAGGSSSAGNGQGGNGGTATGGNINLIGGDGDSAGISVGYYAGDAGAGGASYWGGGGTALGNQNTGASRSGNAYGSGGAGQGHLSSAAGSGKGGIVVVEY